MTPWRIEADRDVCIGSGVCCIYAPGVFEIDDEARVVVRGQTDATLVEVKTAVEACPTGALTLVVDTEATR